MTRDGDAPAARESDPERGDGAAAFVEAVVAQLSRNVENAGAGAQQRVDDLSDRLASILVACEQGGTEPALGVLLEDPVLLSAIFQNIDLLYAEGYPHADAVSMLTLEAVHHAVEAEEG